MGLPLIEELELEIESYKDEILETIDETEKDNIIITLGPISKKVSNVKIISGPETPVKLIQRHLDRKLLRPLAIFRTVPIFVNNLTFEIEYIKNLKNGSRYSYVTVNATVIYNESGEFENLTNLSLMVNKKHTVTVENFTGFFIFMRFRLFDIKAPLFKKFFRPAKFGFLGFCDDITFTDPTTPSLAWTIDDANDNITITSGSSTHKYGASSTDGNLIFKLEDTEYFVKEDLSISTDQTGLSTNTIDAGDVISGFSAGTWSIMWEPTDKLLCEVTFT